MTFTNISHRSVYLTCCHREIPPGSNFVIPWSRVEKDIAVRSAMRNGDLAWVSGSGDPAIPGSPKIPDPAVAERRRQEVARRKREADERTIRKMKADDEAVKANMARMGQFDVPSVSARTKKVEAVNRERPVTQADVIGDGQKPMSLSDIKRHNKAVRTLGKKD